MCTSFLWGNLKERDNGGDPDVDGRIILNGWSSRMCAVFWLGTLRERDYWGEPDVDGRINYMTDGGQKCAQGSGGET
jgi:hypothetical protein